MPSIAQHKEEPPKPQASLPSSICVEHHDLKCVQQHCRFFTASKARLFLLFACFQGRRDKSLFSIIFLNGGAGMLLRGLQELEFGFWALLSHCLTLLVIKNCCLHWPLWSSDTCCWPEAGIFTGPNHLLVPSQDWPTYRSMMLSNTEVAVDPSKEWTNEGYSWFIFKTQLCSCWEWGTLRNVEGGGFVTKAGAHIELCSGWQVTQGYLQTDHCLPSAPGTSTDRSCLPTSSSCVLSSFFASSFPWVPCYLLS